MKEKAKRFLKSSGRSAVRVLTDRRFGMCLAMLLIVGAGTAFAADPFAEATGKIKSYQDTVQNLLYAIAAIIALVGAFNVYHKMTNGDQDVKKTIMLTLGGCIAMVALSNALPKFFEGGA